MSFTENAAQLRPPAHGRDGQQGMNPALQGMRGIAILLVLLNHASVPGFEGGYIGVDIFFVISGYLIGGLLLREFQRTGRIDLLAFYARRCRRLLPAFFVLVFFVVCAIRWLYAPFEHAELLSSARASALYVVNLWFGGRSVDYFAGHTEANPLLHLWSLAVEEQFYLFWPVLMIGIAHLFRRDVRRSVFWLVIVVSLASLVACIAVTKWKLPYAFFLTPFRAWEFGAGVAYACRPTELPRLKNGAVSVLGVAALVAIAGATMLMDSKTVFPGYYAMIPVAAAVALLVVAEHATKTLPGTVLGHPVLRWFGDCSYSLYLWHWPLLLFAALLMPQSLTLAASLAVVVSLAIGWLSYRWVETPFKGHLLQAWSPRGVVLSGLLVGIATAGSAHVMGRMNIDSGQTRFQKATKWPDAAEGPCMALFDAVDQPPCEFGSRTPHKTIVLFGDSHAMQWFSPLEALATQNSWRLITLTKSACPSIDVVVTFYVKRAEYKQCSEWRERMFARIGSLRPDMVIVASSSGYNIAPEQWRKGVSRTLQRIQSYGIPVVYLRDTPNPGFDIPTCLARADWRGQSPDALCSYDRTDGEIWRTNLAEAEAAAAAERGVDYWDLSSEVCPQKSCTTERDGIILFKDRNHISADFSLALKPEFEKRIDRFMVRKEGPQ